VKKGDSFEKSPPRALTSELRRAVKGHTRIPTRPSREEKCRERKGAKALLNVYAGRRSQPYPPPQKRKTFRRGGEGVFRACAAEGEDDLFQGRRSDS